MFSHILARIEENQFGEVKKQSLTDHLLEVGRIAGELGDTVGLKYMMMQIGFLHDMGKADSIFQDYLRGLNNKKVDHSSAGAKLWAHILTNTKDYGNDFRFKYYKEVILYVIQSHHGLFDVTNMDNRKNRSFERLNYNDADGYHFNEEVVPYYNYLNDYLIQHKKYSINDLVDKGFMEFNLIFDKLKQMAKSNPSATLHKDIYLSEFNYYISCLVRLCLSILKEADIYDSANIFEKEKQKIWTKSELQDVWNDGSSKIEKIYKEYSQEDNPSELNIIRTEMADMAKCFAFNHRDGIFQLEMPTGGGKTKSSFRYALTNAKTFNKNRIFYITAFLSVLEQNANEIKEIISNDSIILEHHSNLLLEEEKYDEQIKYNEEQRILNYLKESWEAPIVLTTMVQFCNTLYKGQASQIRRFCKLIDSVIIIDEVQSLPLKVIYNFNLMMNFMKNIMHCNVVHCTATQPLLDSKALSYPVHYGDTNSINHSIIEKNLVNKSCFDRVEYYNLTGKNATKKMSTADIINHVDNSLKDFSSCLIVLNTKKAVKTLYEKFSLKTPDVKVVYLTTNLCAAHRLEIIQDIKSFLIQNRNNKSQKKLICISTQLIEAGVDLDFDCVYRSMAGIDSLVQCAGRCNREGKLSINGKHIQGRIYIINYDVENLGNLRDIKQTVDTSEEAIRSMNIIDESAEISLDEIKSYYFNKYYKQNERILYYWSNKSNENMIDQLSLNRNSRAEYRLLHHTKYTYQLAQSFRTAADSFDLIRQDTVGVIVYYKNDDLIEQLYLAISNRDSYKISMLLKKLQRTTVNVYNNEKLKPYVSNMLSKEFAYGNGQILLLEKHNYNDHMGIVTEGLADLII
jgi:CRISPR-associated endonuclease/helicase Cas3